MSRFCSRCGSELRDGDIFCGNCGKKSEIIPEEKINIDKTEAGQRPAEQAFAEQPIDEISDPCCNSDNKKTALLIGGIAIVIVAAIIGLILLVSAIFGVSGAEGALSNYLSVMQNPVAENIEKMASEEYWDYVLSDAYSHYEDVDEALEYGVDIYERALETYEDDYGDNIRFSFKTEKEKEVNPFLLDDVKDLMKYRYDISKKDIKKMVNFDVLITIKGDEDEYEYSRSLYAIQIRDDWYIINKRGEFVGVKDIEYRDKNSGN